MSPGCSITLNTASTVWTFVQYVIHSILAFIVYSIDFICLHTNRHLYPHRSSKDSSILNYISSQISCIIRIKLHTLINSIINFINTARTMATTTTETPVILVSEKDWDPWSEVIKTVSLEHNLWEYIDPSTPWEQVPRLIRPIRPTPSTVKPPRASAPGQ